MFKQFGPIIKTSPQPERIQKHLNQVTLVAPKMFEQQKLTNLPSLKNPTIARNRQFESSRHARLPKRVQFGQEIQRFPSDKELERDNRRLLSPKDSRAVVHGDHRQFTLRNSTNPADKELTGFSLTNSLSHESKKSNQARMGAQKEARGAEGLGKWKNQEVAERPRGASIKNVRWQD